MIQRHLEEVGEKQRDLEERGVSIEKIIRGETGTNRDVGCVLVNISGALTCIIRTDKCNHRRLKGFKRFPNFFLNFYHLYLDIFFNFLGEIVSYIEEFLYNLSKNSCHWP